ncbi:MAG: site-specific DNA-methyltransferase [Methylococcales bacterium]
MDKITKDDEQSQSKDILADNIKQLLELFPSVSTEGEVDGKPQKKIDFDALKEVLGEYIEDKEERYNFTWHGKANARRLAQTPSVGTLRPCKEESVDWDTTQNLFIEGDNLEVLKLLQKSYHKKVKMIYIDPPYNTGKEFIYPDKYQDNLDTYLKYTGQIDDEGFKISANTETTGRYHTNWLNMMYPRLKLARNLLRDDGVIFISIDDNEVASLRKTCDEIFGEENFIGSIIWKKKTNGNNVGHIPPVHDYILSYSKSCKDELLLGFPIEQKFIDKTYSNPDNDPRGSWTTSDLSANHVGPHFKIINPKTEEVHYPPKGRYWVFNETEVLSRIEDGRIIFGKTGISAPIQKKYLSERKSMRFKPESWWNKHGMNSDGTAELAQLFKPKIFDHPKPTIFLEHIINISTSDQDLIVDFFAGSGSCAHAAMSLNTKDGSDRRIISVQLPEIFSEETQAHKDGFKNIAELAKERIRRASNKIKQENPDYQGDLGFKVFKLDATNINPWEADFDNLESILANSEDSIKSDRSSEDVLYEILLKYGLDLTLPIKEHSIANKTIFDVGMGALLVCLDDSIPLEVAEGIGKLKEELQPEVMRVVFKDAGFNGNDNVKTNSLQVLKQFGIDDVKSI